jgi:hypothetical protein
MREPLVKHVQRRGFGESYLRNLKVRYPEEIKCLLAVYRKKTALHLLAAAGGGES